MRYLFLIVMIGAMSACASGVATPYGPANAKGYGYQDSRIEDNRVRITYRGDGATSPERVEDYALLRAAELALEGGYDWFRVVRRDLSGEEKGGVSLGAGLGTGSYGRSSGVSVGVGGNLGRIGSSQYYTARLEALFGKGEKPADGPENGEVYDARTLVETIRGRIGP